MANPSSSQGYFDELENAILAAGDYVHPTEDLRPSTLEAAQELGAIRRGRRGSLILGLALLITPMLVTPIVQHLAEVRRQAVVTADDLHERAAIRSGVSGYWALLEAFCQLRQEQAEQFGSSHNQSVSH